MQFTTVVKCQNQDILHGRRLDGKRLKEKKIPPVQTEWNIVLRQKYLFFSRLNSAAYDKTTWQASVSYFIILLVSHSFDTVGIVI